MGQSNSRGVPPRTAVLHSKYPLKPGEAKTPTAALPKVRSIRDKLEVPQMPPPYRADGVPPAPAPMPASPSLTSVTHKVGQIDFDALECRAQKAKEELLLAREQQTVVAIFERILLSNGMDSYPIPGSPSHDRYFPSFEGPMSTHCVIDELSCAFTILRRRQWPLLEDMRRKLVEICEATASADLSDLLFGELEVWPSGSREHHSPGFSWPSHFDIQCLDAARALSTQIQPVQKTLVAVLHDIIGNTATEYAVDGDVEGVQKMRHLLPLLEQYLTEPTDGDPNLDLLASGPGASG